MSSLTKAFLALVTLSLVAVAVGLAGWSDEPPPDRSRPVIIGRTGDADGDRARGGDDRPRPEPTPRQDDPGSGPTVITPKPRELSSTDGPDDAGEEDETDPGQDDRGDDTGEDTSEDVDDDEGGEGDGGDD